MARDRAIVVRPGEGRVLPLGDALELSFKVDEAETDGRYAISATTAGPEHPGTTAHVHREHDDVFYVTAGTLAFQVGDEAFGAPAGTLVVVPRGLAHRWWNPLPEPVAFLNLHVPGYGFERFVGELSELSAAGTASPGAMVELGLRYDVHFDEEELESRYGA